MERYAEALAEFDAAETFPLSGVATMGEPIFWQGETLFRLRRLEEARDRYARFLALKPGVALRAGGALRARPGRARDGARRRRDRHVPGLPARLSEPPAGADRGVQRGARADPRQALGRRARAARARTRRTIRRAPISRRRATSWAWPSSRPAVPKARGRSSSSSRRRRRATSCPRRACSRPRPRPRPGGPREALEQYQALVRAAPTHALVPQALYRIGELSLRLGRPTDAEAAWTTLRRDLPAEPAGRARRVSRPPGFTSSDEAVGAGAPGRPVRGRPEGRGALGRPPRSSGRARCSFAGTRRPRRPTTPWWWRPPRARSDTSRGWPGSPPRSTPRRTGRRQARVPRDHRRQPGSGARALGQGPARCARGPAAARHASAEVEGEAQGSQRGLDAGPQDRPHARDGRAARDARRRGAAAPRRVPAAAARGDGRASATGPRAPAPGPPVGPADPRPGARARPRPGAALHLERDEALADDDRSGRVRLRVRRLPAGRRPDGVRHGPRVLRELPRGAGGVRGEHRDRSARRPGRDGVHLAR